MAHHLQSGMVRGTCPVPDLLAQPHGLRAIRGRMPLEPRPPPRVTLRRVRGCDANHSRLEPFERQREAARKQAQLLQHCDSAVSICTRSSYHCKHTFWPLRSRT